MADVQYYDGTDWVTVSQAQWRVENGVSSKLPAPRAVIETTANTDIGANTDIRIVEGGSTIFEGFARTGGEYGQSGSQRIECRGDAWRLMEEEVSVSRSSTTDETVISTALSNTEFGADFSLSYPETAINVGDYEADGRQFQVVLRDMMDRSGRVWWFDSATKTLNVQSLGYRGEWEQLETERDGIFIQSWNEGDIATVQNEVAVEGTGSDPVSATATDSTSINDYGRHSITYSYRWIRTQAQAQDLADALLIPDPLQSGKVLVADRDVSRDTYENAANYSVTLSDSARNINSVVAAIEKQVIQEGRTTLHVGKGSGYAESVINRDSQSKEDAVRTNLNQLDGTMDDVDDGTDFGKILKSAIQNGYHTLDAAVGDLDDVTNGSIYSRVRTQALQDGYHLLSENIGDLDDVEDGTQYAKVNEGNIDPDGYVLLASSVGDLDDVPDGSNYGRIETVAIDSGRILLEEAIGDLDNIGDGANYAKVLSTNIEAGKILLAESNGDLDDIDDGANYGKVSTTNISAGNILLSESVGDLDDIDDGSNYGKVSSTNISAGDIVLAEALGDLDDIDDGTNYGKVDITNLTPGGAVFATGVELDDGRRLDAITADDGGATVIDGGEILTGSITANEIDVLDLDSDTITIGQDNSNYILFEASAGGGTEMIPDSDGTAAVGAPSARFNYGGFDNLEGDDYGIGGTNSYIQTPLDIDIPGQIGFRIEEAGSGQRLIPDSDGYGRIGDSNDRMYGVYALNVVEGSPEPLDPNDPRTKGATDGGGVIDLTTFLGTNWGNAPEYAKQRHQPDGTWAKEDDGNLELGHTLNYVWEAAKEIERERQRLADRVEDLEERLSKLEQSV